MGSHHPRGGSAGRGSKMPRYVLKKNLKQKQAAFHPEPVVPSGGEGSPLMEMFIVKL